MFACGILYTIVFIFIVWTVSSWSYRQQTKISYTNGKKISARLVSLQIYFLTSSRVFNSMQRRLKQLMKQCLYSNVAILSRLPYSKKRKWKKRCIVTSALDSSPLMISISNTSRIEMNWRKTNYAFTEHLLQLLPSSGRDFCRQYTYFSLTSWQS